MPVEGSTGENRIGGGSWLSIVPEYVNVSPSGSLDPVPFNVTIARQVAPADAIWSGPASAVGGLLTLVTSVTALLALFGSEEAPDTTAVLVSIPGTVARTTMVT